MRCKENQSRQYGVSEHNVSVMLVLNTVTESLHQIQDEPAFPMVLCSSSLGGCALFAVGSRPVAHANCSRALYVNTYGDAFKARPDAVLLEDMTTVGSRFTI